MKQRNSIVALILMCCLCLVLMTGCDWLFNSPVQYKITIDSSIEHGNIQCDKETAAAGDTVNVTAEADDGYQLASITVNGETIDGLSFVMPEEDVVIGATFGQNAELVEAVPEGAIQIKAESAGGGTATGHITLIFGDDGLHFEAFVEDDTVVEKDGVAILFSHENPTVGGLLPSGQTIKISVSAKGVISMLATDSDGVLETATLEGVTIDHHTWSKNGERLNGYHAEAFIPYEVLGVTAESAKGNITVCPVIYCAFGSLPAQATSFNGVTESAQNTFAVLTDDNTVRENKYFMTSAQLGSFGSLQAGYYWDLSKDYYADDTANYPNREARLTGHDANDNNLLFYRVSANEMYARATLTVTGVSNKGDQWPKFGLMLFDGANKNGLFMYVDAIMSGASDNTKDNIIGTAIGYNRGNGLDYGSWITAKDGVFNLGTKSIVLEMVYQDGWVHMYADGAFIASVYYGVYNSNLHFGIKSFGIDLKVTDYLASDDAEADGWADKKRTPPEKQSPDIIFAGDSYMEWWIGRGMANNLSYTDAKYLNLGVGGTRVQYWRDKAQELSIVYAPKKIAFHIGVNDIDTNGVAAETVIEELKLLFEEYHVLFPDTTIYWNNLIPNTMFAGKYADYKVINAAVLEYANDRDWLVYIDQASSFEANGAARQDVFEDGLHLNIDLGYPLWAKNMLTAMGYTRVDGTTMGDTDKFAHTGAWEFGTNDNGEYAYSYGNIDTSLWFKDVYGENVYVEAVFSITALRNNDGYPKFGLMVRNDKESRWGFIDAVAFNNANTTAGMAYRGVDGIAQTSWDWGSVLWGSPTGCNFANVKLAIAKLDNTLYFLVNDVVFVTAPFEGEVSVGYLCYNLETTISNVVKSTDENVIEKKLCLACEDAEIDGEKTDALWTEEVLANTIKFADKGDGRYITVAAVKGTDGVYFLVNTYTFNNTQQSANWWENANVEFRFGNNMDTQQYFYVDGAGFNGVKSSGGISLVALKANGNEGDIYHNTFEFFAPYNSFAGYDVNSEEIRLIVLGWVWDNDGWRDIMNNNPYPLLTISSHGLRFERQISVSGENAGLSVDVPSSARKGDTVVATINVADGQTLSYVKVDGVAYEVVDGKITFTMPDANVSIEAALKGIGVTSEVKDLAGEGFLAGKVNCDTATATVGQTVSFTVEHTAGAKAVVTVNGEALDAADGVYSYVVKATDTAIAIKLELDYTLSEAVDGVMGAGYGAPMTMKVEGGRKFNVWAKADEHGVYLYFEAISSTLSINAADFWGNNNFEFRLNGAEHGGVNTMGAIYRASKGYYSYQQLDNGMYSHTAEVYVNEGWIPEFNSASVDLTYAFKTPGEVVWHDNMVNNQWNRADWWRTSHSTPHGGEPIALGVQSGLPHCIHITSAGLVHDCERASIDGDFSEYPVKSDFIGMGNDNAKFDFVAMVKQDGVYIGITIYQTQLGETRGEWWDTDNLEIKLLGERAGFTIVEDFIAGTAAISDYALVRTYDETLGKYVTKIELYYAYDFSTAKQATFQVGVNGNGFQGWQALMWDGNVPYITENGIEWVTLFVDWWTAQKYVAEKFATGEGITIDGKADEAIYTGATSVTYNNVNGATVVITGRKLSTGIAILSTITHTRPVTDVIQGAGDAWWNFLNVEYHIAGKGPQAATSTFENGDWDQYCASKAVTVDNGDGTYTTTFETFYAFTTEYGAANYSGDVCVAVGVVAESGFVHVAGGWNDETLENWSNLYVNENGFILK